MMDRWGKQGRGCRKVTKDARNTNLSLSLSEEEDSTHDTSVVITTPLALLPTLPQIFPALHFQKDAV